ncbi:unnamed protein product [Candida verbasci]|uniref:Succinate dehydrogenase [ubiquinone] cytochrome b small subunit n=1 Tax=Candida verbasci TaxID=1227364 RepID=A0A9W4XI66_9ASCO|nr:unnamed protein product [Candida verbasci]
MPFRFPVKFEIPKHVHVNARVLRDQHKRINFAQHEVTRNALKYIIRNEELPSRIRIEAQLQLATMPKYTSITQIRDRCIASGNSKSVITDFKLNRTEFRNRALAGQIPGVKVASCNTQRIFTRNLRLIPKFSLQKFNKIPQPPGYIVGTVNDAYIAPDPDQFHGNFHWTYERAVTVAMIPLVMTPFIAGVEYPIIDSICSTLLLFHCNAGFKSCIIDYIPKRVYGIWHNIAMKLLGVGTFVSIYGIYVMETANNGLFDLISKLWTA